jgi:hypothetical protein
MRQMAFTPIRQVTGRKVGKHKTASFIDHLRRQPPALQGLASPPHTVLRFDICLSLSTST